MNLQTICWPLSEYLLCALGLVGITAVVGYYYGTRTYDFWKKKGVRYIKPKYPFFGSAHEIIFNLKCSHNKQQEMYNYFKGEKFGGIFYFQKPKLMILDPKLIELILIKDFSSFYNRDINTATMTEPLQAHLLNLNGNDWKKLRQKLTPFFSSGKIKFMLQQILDCSEHIVSNIQNFIEKSEPVESKDIMSKFAIDVICSCAFGLNSNVLNNPISEFRKIEQKLFHPSAYVKLRIALSMQYRTFANLLRLNGTSVEFFTKVVQNTIAFREKNNVVRHDFVQLLMELKKEEFIGNDKDLSEEEKSVHINDNVIASNAFIFFVAGYETTSSILRFCLYELSLHQDVQEQAFHHVVSVLNKHGGRITYDALQEMTFIEQIYAECLRLHPPTCELRRIICKDYNIPGTNITLPEGLQVIVPTYSLHRDPEYFPEPEKFLPERFDKEKNIIIKGTYLPFGDGPRMCIGIRFAKMVICTALAKMLLSFKFKLHPKTILPLVYDKSGTLVPTPTGGIWIDFEKRA